MTKINSRIALLLVIVVAMFAVAPFAMAQDTFGLSDEDFALFVGANASSTDFDTIAYTFDTTLLVDVGDGEPVDLAINGTGVFGLVDFAPVMTMNLLGEVSAGGTSLPVDIQIIFVDETPYVFGIIPGQWVSISDEDMDLASGALGFDPQELASGDLSALGIEDDAMMSVLGALGSIDPTEYIVMSREDDMEGSAVITIDLLLEDLLQSDAISTVVAAAMSSSDSEMSFEEAQAQAAGTVAMAGMFLAGSEFYFSQYIDLETNMVEEAELGVMTGEASPVVINFIFDVVIDEYDPTVEVTAPEGAISLSEALGS